ncbi:GM16572 [Drosophila sechellia]|uniref:GM16572 n=1 Tax=Drosophila sechellia TaxID=7238 RepID=B4IDF2_DROSE|nr:GM16572 [Drosophila sechellia]
MLKSAIALLCGLLALNLCGAWAESMSSPLKDPPSQCGGYCLGVLMPVLNHLNIPHNLANSSKANEVLLRQYTMEGQLTALEDKQLSTEVALDAQGRKLDIINEQNFTDRLNGLESILSAMKETSFVLRASNGAGRKLRLRTVHYGRKDYAMRQLLVYALVAGLFYFSEGKPCPEKTRPHKTRCDAFYKCRELPSNSHVWIPVKCNEGLVFESSLGSCVLPGEDWECITPSEMSSTQSPPGRPDADILIVNDMDEAGLLLSESSHKDDGTVEIVLDSTLSSEENEDSEKAAQSKSQPEEDISSSHNFDSSGDGELVELDSPAGLKPENREEVTSSSMEHRTEVEKLRTELKQVAGISEIAKPGSPIDPSLTAHLQRLSQLIDGLQQTYQKTDKPQTEMRPDQLNAFLAHFDIKNRYEMMKPHGADLSHDHHHHQYHRSPQNRSKASGTHLE